MIPKKKGDKVDFKLLQMGSDPIALKEYFGNNQV